MEPEKATGNATRPPGRSLRGPVQLSKCLQSVPGPGSLAEPSGAAAAARAPHHRRKPGPSSSSTTRTPGVAPGAATAQHRAQRSKRPHWVSCPTVLVLKILIIFKKGLTFLHYTRPCKFYTPFWRHRKLHGQNSKKRESTSRELLLVPASEPGGERTLGKRRSLRFKLITGLSISESTPAARSAKAVSRSPLILTLIYNGTFSNAALPDNLKNTKPFNLSH